MSTRASLVYPKDGEGSWGFYLELLDDTVHFEISTAGVSIDIELMPISQWQALGFPNRFAAPNIASTGIVAGAPVLPADMSADGVTVKGADTTSAATIW